MADRPFPPGRRPGLGATRRRIPATLLRRPPAASNGALKSSSRILLALVLLGVLATLFSAGSVYGAYAQLANSLQGRLDTLQKHEGFQTSRIYDRNGTLLYEFFDAGKRTRVPLSQISPLLIHATVSIEDKTFFKNSGVDYEGIMKAAYRAMSAGEEQGGASTITQQLIKQAVLTEEEKSP